MSNPVRKITAFLMALSAVAVAQANDYYIADSAQGTGDASSAGNAAAYTFFNNFNGNGPLNFSTTPGTAGKISPGDTVHLVGTFTHQLVLFAQGNGLGSGASGNPITLHFETNAVMTSAAWGTTGAIYLNQVKYFVIDGGSNGQIQNTANGTGLANQVNSVGVYAADCESLTVQNLTVVNMYVATPGDLNQYGTAIEDAGSNTGVIQNFTVTNCTIHDAAIGVYSDFGAANCGPYTFSSNTIYNCNWGVAMGDRGSAGVAANGIYFHDNHIYNFSNWDSGSGGGHHNGLIIFCENGGTCRNIYAYNNIIGPNFGSWATAGIFLDTNSGSGSLVGPVLIYDNVFLENTNDAPGDGLITPGLSPGGVARIYNNDFLCGGAGNAMQIGCDAGGTQTFFIANNIVTNYGSAIYAIYSASLSITSNDNDFYNPTTPSQAFSFSTSNSASFMNLATWQGQGFSPDGSSITGNPNLNGSYVPNSGSPVIGAGVSESSYFTTDKAGNAWTSWGMGALEYTGGGSSPSINSALTASGTYGSAFSYAITASNTPTSFGVTGTLPGGVTLNTGTGVISGTPTNTGSFPVTISATNGSGTGTQGLTITISQVPVTVTGITASNKTYNGTTAATLGGSGTLVGVLAGDSGNVTLNSGSAAGTFASKNVANGITVTVSGLALSGSASGNYTLTQPTTTANITAAGLTVTGLTASNKPYDGTTAATLGGSGTLVGVLAGDSGNVTLNSGSATGTFASKNVANGITVTVSGLTLSGSASGNYTLTQPTTTANITALALTVTGITANSKTYDGTTAATLNGSGTLVGVLAGDSGNVTLGGSATGAFASKNVGNNITVNVSGLSLGGSAAGNYSLTQPTTTANITALALTVTGITANSKTYDGTTAATLSGSGTLVGVLAGDSGNVTLGGSATGVFASKNVGNNITVTASGLSLSGSAAGNYSLTQPTALANITALALTVNGITANSKTYDGTTAATLSGSGTLVGVVAGDSGNVTLGGTASGTFATQNVGAGITVTVSGLTLSGSASGNYTLTQPAPTASITALALTVTGISANSKTYDSTTAATLNGSGTLVGVLAGDSGNVTLGGTASGTFVSKNVANGITVTVSGLTISGSASGNYTLTQPTTTANITAAGLTVTGITATNKAYDGTTAATLGGSGTLVGVLAGDVGNVTLNVGGATGTFASKNVANGITVTVSGLILGGSAGGNYTLTQPTTTANITAAGLTVSGITANSKTYDSTTTATLNTGSAALVGVVAGDVGNVTLNTGGATGVFSSKTVGNGKAVTVSGLTLSGSASGNYTPVQPTATANITAATLTVTGITASNKTYDSTTSASLSGSGTPVGVFGGDSVSLNSGGATGTFSSKTVGSGKTVTVSGLTLGGTDSGNYTLIQPSTTANITVAALTIIGVTASNKVYNSTTAATISTGGANLVGVFNGDTVTFSGGTGVFSDKLVGVGKAVTISGIVLGGADSGNYTLTQPTATASITAANLTVAGITASNKTYDATTAATLGGSGTLVGVFGGDSVTLSGTGAGAFSSKTVGVGKTVTVSGLTLSGADSADYTLTQPTATASITAASLTINGVTANNKVYDGTTADTISTVGATLVGVFAGDIVTYSGGSGTFSDANVGNGKSVTISGIILGGADGGNYTLTQPGPKTANITPATAIVTLSNLSQTYDGTPKSVTVVTTPIGLANTVTYNGSATVPSAIGSYTVVATVTDPNYTGNNSGILNIALVGGPVITSALTASVTSGAVFSYSITATNSPASYNATGLPTTLTVNTGTGAITGTPVAAGTFNFTISATNAVSTGSAILALTVNPPAPVITSALTATGSSTANFGYTVTATNAPTSFSAAGLPGGLAINSVTGAITGVPTAGGVFSVTISATNVTGTGSALLALTVNSPPVITSPLTGSSAVGTAFGYTIAATSSPTGYFATGLPAGLTLNPSTGAIAGTPTATGTFNITLGATNAAGTGFATLVLTVTPPVPAITSTLVASGSTAQSFGYATTATNSPTSFNATGLPIGLSINPSTGIIAGTPTAGGVFNVTLSATNASGTGSATLVLTINSPPIFTLQPVSQSVAVGGTATFTIAVGGYPTPTLQWQMNGSSLGNSSTVSGVTGSILTIASLVPGEAGLYTAVATNSSGSAASSGAVLTVSQASFSGVYFGTLAGGGTFALYVRSDNTGIFIAYLGGTPIVEAVTVDPDGSFSGSGTTTSSLAKSRLQRFVAFPLSGQISSGSVSGTVGSTTISGSQDTASSTAAYSGYYSGSALGTSTGSTYAIVGGDGQIFILAVYGSSADALSGTLASNGTISGVTANQGQISLSLNSQGQLSAAVTPAGSSAPISFSGLSNAVAASVRLVNLSALATAGTGSNTLIAGFVIEGGAKSMLLRGIGPALTSFGVAGALDQPVLMLYSGATVVVSNGGWGGTAALQNVFQQTGAFALNPASADDALVSTLNGGAYSAEVTAGDGTTGPAMVELYDADTGSNPAGRLVNISARSLVGSGNVLSAGFVIAGNTPETVLIRAVGPSLVPFGVTGALLTPQLDLYQSGTVIQENIGWGNSSALSAAFNQVGAFALSSPSDAAILVTLQPGQYSAVVSGAGGAAGVALVEVYEVP